MEILESIKNYNFFGLSLTQIIIFTGILFLIMFIEKFLSLIVFKFLKNKAEKTKTGFDNDLIHAVEKPIIWLFYIISIYLALFILGIKDTAIPLQSTVKGITETLVAILLTWMAFRLVDVFNIFLAEQLNKKGEKNKDMLVFYFFPLLKRALKFAIVLISLIIIVQNWGYSVTSLVAGFGITGLAVGFAAKESISNVFGSVFIVADHVYKQGDWIIVDRTISGNNAEGIVEDISLRSTKIRAFDNTLIIIPNNEMANATIKNVSAHKKRRIYEFVDITYDTPPEKVELAVEICRKIVREHSGMEEYQQIHFNQFGAHSLKIMLYIFTKTNDWGEYLKIRQEIFLSIFREFNNHGIEFAFPTQTLYLNQNLNEKDNYSSHQEYPSGTPGGSV